MYETVDAAYATLYGRILTKLYCCHEVNSWYIAQHESVKRALSLFITEGANSMNTCPTSLQASSNSLFKVQTRVVFIAWINRMVRKNKESWTWAVPMMLVTFIMQTYFSRILNLAELHISHRCNVRVLVRVKFMCALRMTKKTTGLGNETYLCPYKRIGHF